MDNSYFLDLNKWWITIKISWVKHMAYRFNFLLQVIGPALIFFLIKYNLWKTIYHTANKPTLKGFDLDEMITYHAWTFVVMLVGQGHASWNLSEDIRMGRISSYLIYPFNFWEFHTASFLSFQSIQIFIASISLLSFTALGLIHFEFYIWMQGFCLTLMVSFFWYVLQYLTGILAFWLEETWILRVILSIVANFLSGAIIPLDLYPPWLTWALQYTPFPYLVYYPVQILMGHSVNLGQSYLIVALWMAILIFFSRFLWRKGMKLYTAAGM